MPSHTIRNRKQDAVLFTKSGYDAFGKPTVSDTPTKLKVRWEDRNEEVTDPQGNTIGTEATVVVDRAITIGSVLWKGSYDDLPDDLSTLTDLKEVVTYSETPDVKGRNFRRVVRVVRYKNALPGTG